ncbi:glycosyltransferase family 2 protein [Planococcus shixiaomingii]|uniref:glycosyltransferase family 2 protein n=1 Tax=Planococcus shixiaomingii TaxID=3058393 RepID=UPI0026051723|nr:glycosyltransferase family 2 protein [Planococcus sp. N022]WKA53961.1 glycosyltransferase family 2 protein [Planococcus sp. N022]
MQKDQGLSVIIPFYNVEDYIEECLKSVVVSKGGLSNIQIILVDDGSKDGSGAIAKKYADAYSDFLYLTKDNGGVSDARNFGLNYVQYNYVTFFDSDDFIQKSFFERIVKTLQNQPDMIIYDWWDFEDGRLSQVVKGMDLTEVLWTVQPSVCNKVYKTSLFANIKFPSDRICEDVETIFKLLYYTDTYIYINESLYSYRKNRKGSLITTVSPKINDIYLVLEDTYDFYNVQGALSGENREGLCYQYVKLLCWSNMYRQLQFFKFDFWGFYQKMKTTRELVYKRFPEWKDNDYLKRNRVFFMKRLGNNYINKLDDLGKSPFKTFNTVFFLVVKNRKRMSKRVNAA